METRANHIWVGAVTLVLLALAAATIIWIARLNQGARDEYDIFFKQSVDGLAKGSEVAFQGVPVGQIKTIELWKKDPTFVRVRIAVDKEVPVVVGTTATIQGSFTGVSDIQLEGAVRGAPPITEPGPEGVPVIPTKRSGLGEILNSAPLLLERLATLTDRLTQLLSDKNQKSFEGILANTNKMTADISEATPELKATLRELQGTLREASGALANFQKVADKTDALLGDESGGLAKDLSETMKSARTAASQLEGALNDARPSIRQISSTTLPAAEAAIRDLRETSRALRAITEKLDERGAAALVGGNKLPDYKP
ncbi:MAG: MlaD family protein [Novosphingobium sp.]|nr:MlaD family protein [Novosphingobium sp.]